MSDEYLLSFHKDDLLEILSHVDTSKHFSITINLIQLHDHNPELVIALLNDPETNLEEWDKSALRTQLTLLKEVDKNFELKSNVHCRVLITHLGRRGAAFPGNKDEGTFMRVSGTVMRITTTKLLEYQRNYVCVKCKYPTIVKADYNRKYMIKQPTHCKNPESCPGTNLINFGELDSDNCKDYQEIKIQEQVKKLGMGSVPNTIWVTLEDDLVDSCQPGDDVTICGTVRRRYGEFCPGKRTDIDLVFKANHIQVDTNNSSFSISNPESENMFNTFWEQYAQNPLEGRDLILKSFCPEIYGLYPVKLAIAIILAGGCAVEDTTSTGVRTRSESHLLLVGDPGTGKSQLLRFAAKIVPRAVLTTGVGSTAAGLTVTALREHGEWQLEAGALVMSDGGICCIDEFNSMKEHDRTTIHEAMEQQTISVAKASMVCKLNTRCAILAACNPKGNIDPTQPMSINIALPSPLLSRFDLVMMLRDTVNQEWDNLVIDYILSGGSSFSKLTNFGLWPVKNLQAYFKRIKKLQPKLTEQAELILRTYYNVQRRVESRNKARTTVRLLESLVRLSQGHARLMFHEKVQVIDSIFAIFLADVSMDIESSILNLNIHVNSIFPERPRVTYKNILESILNKLQLTELLEKEMEILCNTKEKQIQSRFFANQRSDFDHSGDNVNTATFNFQFKTKEQAKLCNNQRTIEERDKNNMNESSKNQQNFSKKYINTENEIIGYIGEKNTIDKTSDNSTTTNKKLKDCTEEIIRNSYNCDKNNVSNTDKDIIEEEITHKNSKCDNNTINSSKENEQSKLSSSNNSQTFEYLNNLKNNVLNISDGEKFDTIFESAEVSFRSNKTNAICIQNNNKLSKLCSSDIVPLTSEKDNCRTVSDESSSDIVPLTSKKGNCEVSDKSSSDIVPLISEKDNCAVSDKNSSDVVPLTSEKDNCEVLDKSSSDIVPLTSEKNNYRALLDKYKFKKICEKQTGKKRGLNDPEKDESVTKKRQKDCEPTARIVTENDVNIKSLNKRTSSMFESGFDESIFDDDSIHETKKKSSNTTSKNMLNNITKKPSTHNKKSLSRYSLKSSNSGNSVENYLEALNMMPGINDDFMADLDTDWDNIKSIKSQDTPYDSVLSGRSDSDLRSNKNNIFGTFEEDVDFNV